MTGLPRWGSSPRVRGKPHARRVGPRLHGLIPACAGKTADPEAKRLARTAHPRVCGENPNARSYSARLMGSSPRVRGKLREGDHAGLPARLIPACAGKTGWFIAPGLQPPAHPRVCGENEVGVKVTADLEGSSPRVRGKQPLRVVLVPRGGLIPARAGKTRM